MLVLALEWEPRPATVAWANSIAALPQYADYTAVLITHNYLQSDNTRSTSTNIAEDASGQELWDNLVKTHSNFQMVFNGHFGGDGVGRLDSINNAGKTVHQMFLNSQFETLGGDGWIRLIEFLQDGKTVRVRTYSPFQDLYRTGPDYAFEFQLSDVPLLDGDYNGNGTVDAADYVIFRNQVGMFGPNLAADGNHDNNVTVTDFGIWLHNFGEPFGSAAGQGVPEPRGMILALAATFALALCRSGRQAPRRA
jgi:hypothetical protein